MKYTNIDFLELRFKFLSLMNSAPNSVSNYAVRG